MLSPRALWRFAKIVILLFFVQVTNKSRNRIPFLKMLAEGGPLIFLPFFTLVGVQLNLPILVQSILFGVLVFIVRALCVVAGSYVGGGLAGLDMPKRKKMWMTMLAQAGVSLGLAAEVAVKFPVSQQNIHSTRRARLGPPAVTHRHSAAQLG